MPSDFFLLGFLGAEARRGSRVTPVRDRQKEASENLLEGSSLVRRLEGNMEAQ